MGYRRPRKTYRLVFDDPEYAGLEVRMAGLSVGEFTRLTAALGPVSDDPAALAASASAGTGEVIAAFTRSIIEWNLEEDDGRPVPVTAEGVNGQDTGFVMTIIMAWMDAIAGVDPISRASANGGGTAPLGLVPMETLSPSPAN